MAACYRLKHAKHVFAATKVQDGNSEVGPIFVSEERLGSVTGPHRRLPARAHSPGISEISQSGSQGQGFHVQSSAVRAVAQPVGFYSYNGRGALPCQAQDGIPSSGLPGRHSAQECTAATSGVRQGSAVASAAVVRLSGQPGKIGPAAQTALRAPRNEVRHGRILGRLSREESHQDSSGHGRPVTSAHDLTQRGVSGDWPVPGCGGLTTVRMVTPETSSVGGGRLVSTQPRLGPQSLARSRLSARPGDLDKRSLATTSGADQTTSTRPLVMHGCISVGLGRSSPSGVRYHRRTLVRRGESTTHQRSGNASCVKGGTSLAIEAGAESCPSSVRQLHSRGLREQAGRHEIALSLPGSQPPLTVRSGERDYSDSQAHSGKTQRDRRCALQNQSRPNRVGAVNSSLSVDQGAVSGDVMRRLCDTLQPEVTEVFLPVSRPGGSPDRRALLSMGGPRRLRVPTDTADTQAVGQAGIIRRPGDVGGSSSPPQSLVHDAGEQAVSHSQARSSDARPADATSLGRTDARSGEAQPSYFPAVRRALEAKGFSHRAVARILSSRRRSTLTVYEKKWLRFERWCAQHSLDPVALTPPQLADFFVFLFEEEGLQPITIKGYRAAIARVYRLMDNSWDPGAHQHLSELLQNFSLERPVTRRLFPKWDIDMVLDYLRSAEFEPLEAASTPRLTQKAVFLVIMATAGRVSELHAMSTLPDCLRFNVDGSCTFTLHPTFLAKNQLPDTAPTPIQLLPCHPPENCPVRALRLYLRATEADRRGQHFVWCAASPRARASKQLLSSWIKATIKEAYTRAAEARAEAARVPAQCGPPQTEGRGSQAAGLAPLPQNVAANQTPGSPVRTAGGGPSALRLVRMPAHSRTVTLPPVDPGEPDLSRPAHELRAVATSIAYQLGTPIQDIIRAVGWHSASTFGRFYLRHLRCHELEARDVVYPGRPSTAPSSP